MSDANGVGTWKIPASIRATATGVFPGSSITASSNRSGTVYSNVYIDLREGKWSVNTGLTISNPGNTNRFWFHAYLSTSQSSVQRAYFTHLALLLYLPRTLQLFFHIQVLLNDGALSMLSSPSIRIYLLIENKATGSWTFGTGAYENYFYAIPLN
ncbi:hypothetical protein LF887_10630 [Chryseobacterium sp. MEBOG06]|uniref:hypothetical protein n=1 Tax=Chryseobacterium sp. MEBOG06 TaxID=2879938 RepID=UPI001F1B152D|nr:hypothetical protein [Chryseobacterium sp. MEBOG06]UKB86054.1 hypothetical protein LF887_10630 [Chryseobacterium sp. MEBOG06]